MVKLAQYWKAILGFITPGVVALGVAVTDDSAAGSDITRTEWVGIVVAMLLTGTAVAVKRNGPSNDPTTSTPMTKT